MITEEQIDVKAREKGVLPAFEMKEIHEEGRCERLRRLIAEAYKEHPTGCGNSFDEILCWEIHENGLTFCWLAEKWGISLPTLGELIWEHCKALEGAPEVNHYYRRS